MDFMFFDCIAIAGKQAVIELFIVPGIGYTSKITDVIGQPGMESVIEVQGILIVIHTPQVIGKWVFPPPAIPGSIISVIGFQGGVRGEIKPQLIAEGEFAIGNIPFVILSGMKCGVIESQIGKVCCQRRRTFVPGLGTTAFDEHIH